MRRVVAPKHSQAREFRFGAGQPRQRLIVLLGALVLVLALVLFKVGVLQTSEGDALRIEGTRQWTRSRDVPADRGTIFDRNGEELAMSVPANSVSINPKLIDDPEGTATILDQLLGLTEERRHELIAAMVAKDNGVRVRRPPGRRVGRRADRGARAGGRQRRPRGASGSCRAATPAAA